MSPEERAMPNRVWLCLEALAASVEEEHLDEGIIDQLEKEMRSFPPDRLDRIKTQLDIAIAQLARLALRFR